MGQSVAHELVEKCRDWHQLLSNHLAVYYSRFSVEPPATAEQLELLRANLDFEPCPALMSTWQVCASLHFEWFVKLRAMQAVGIDSRRAPGGRFKLLTPAEALSEKSFLHDLGSAHDQVLMASLPFAKVGESGELLVANHYEPGEYSVDVVLLDNELNRVRIGADFESWLRRRLGDCMEDSLLAPDQEITHEVKAVLDGLRQDELEWPPPALRQSPFEGNG